MPTIMIGEETRDQVKARLKKQGLWGQYVKDRAAVALGNGISLVKAARIMLADEGSGYRKPNGWKNEDYGLAGVTPLMVDMGKSLARDQAELKKMKGRLGGGLADGKVWEGRSKVGLVEEVMWVKEHICVDVGVEESPSAGAWAMLMYAREKPDKFWSEFVGPMVVSAQKKVDDVVRRRDDGRELVTRCKAIVERMEVHGHPFSEFSPEGFGGEFKVSESDIRGGDGRREGG